MKKTLFLIAALLAAIQGFSQDNRPGGYEATAFKLADFHQNIIVMDGDYTIPSSLKVEVYNNGLKLSDTTDVTIVGDTIKFKLTPAQLAPLVRAPVIYLKDTLATVDPYLLAINLTVKAGYSTPTGTDKTVYIKKMGNIRISFVGDASTAIYAANRAKLSEQLAIAARDSSNRILDSMSVNYTSRLKFGSAATLRATPETISSYRLAAGMASGNFVADPTDVTTADDSVMTIIKSGMRYKRIDWDAVRPEWFGAIPGDAIDDYAAIQRCLNLAGSKGLKVLLSNGTYLISNTLKPKKINGKTQYKIAFVGQGKGNTVLKGTTGIAGKNLIELLPEVGDGFREYSYIHIEGIEFEANGADRALYIDNFIGLQIFNCLFKGGKINCVRLGSGSLSYENFFSYIQYCYFNAANPNGAHTETLLKMQVRFPEVHNVAMDGGYYGLEEEGGQLKLAGSTFEGQKGASVYTHGNGGGEHQITNNSLRPYVGYEAGGLFDGTMSCLRISGSSGGQTKNSISDNSFYLGPPADHGKVLIVSAGTYLTSPNQSIQKITGGTSGATAAVIGFNSVANRLVLANITGGPFVVGETITQAVSGATGTITSIPDIHTYGLELLNDGGLNAITANTFDGPEYCLRINNNNSVIGSNIIQSSLGGILLNGHATVTGNYIYAGGIAFKKTAGIVTFQGNSIESGTLDGIAPQPFTPVTTTQRDAITATFPGIPPGLMLFNSTTAKMNFWNGSAWAALP